MDQPTPAIDVRRLVVAGLVALVAVLAVIGVTGLGNANAAGTSGTPAPSYEPVRSGTPDTTPPADERPDGEDCPERGGSDGGEEPHQQQDGSATPSPAPDTAPDV